MLVDGERDRGESTARQAVLVLDAGLVESRSPETELQHGTGTLVPIRTATLQPGNVNERLIVTEQYSLGAAHYFQCSIRSPEDPNYFDRSRMRLWGKDTTTVVKIE